MLIVSLFWCATSLLLLTAACFIVPPLWLTTDTKEFSIRHQFIYSALLVSLLVSCSYFLYLKLGAAQHLATFYSPDIIAQRQSFKQLRPLYARIQRAMVMDQLDLKLDLENIDLILNFAQIHSQSQQGLLQPEIQQLLLAVLKTIPQQVTALNLLAINAYKTAQYSQAIDYWQNILEQLKPLQHNSDAEKILRAKIAETADKVRQQENSQAS